MKKQTRTQEVENRADLLENRALLTDLYQLTMGAVYHNSEKNDEATFELFIRKLPVDWGFYIANGIEDAVDYITNLRFTDEQISYLEGKGIFEKDFLESLRDFKFSGEVYAVREGTPLTPNAPLMRVTAPRIQAQLLETMLLNTVNFQTMIATKANRVVQSADGAKVVDFGLRRAQERDAAMKGARASYIAGSVGTSNVEAGMKYGIPITGTMAHALVMSFPTELEAFRAYAKTFPNSSTLLIDTYDTIQGAKNAVVVGKELEARGSRLAGVRLDSGELAELSKKVRRILDEAGLNYVKIFASNDLNEYKISELRGRGSKIDAYGVGTEMITAKPVAAISGVYKLVEDVGGAKIKLSEDKLTYPGKKQIYRHINSKTGKYLYDTLALEAEEISGNCKPLLERVVASGARVTPRRGIEEIRRYCLEEVAKIPDSAKQLHAQPYELQISGGVSNLVGELTKQYGVRK